MKLDDDVCLCFHVSLRKIIRFVRIEKPRRASQISECYGAGTGCGWCRPFLKRILEETAESEEESAPGRSFADISEETYRQQRKQYREQQRSKPASSDQSQDHEEQA